MWLQIAIDEGTKSDFVDQLDTNIVHTTEETAMSRKVSSESSQKSLKMIKDRVNKKDTRRRLLTALAATGATGLVLPEKWARPAVDSVMLPAHAQTTTGGAQFVGSILTGIVSTEPPARARSGDLVDFFISPAFALDDPSGGCMELETKTGTLYDGDKLDYIIIKDGTTGRGSTTVQGDRYTGTLDGESGVTLTFQHSREGSIVKAINCIIEDALKGKTYSVYCPGGNGQVFTCSTIAKETSSSSGAIVYT